jgi:hypothetical protein
MADQQTSLMEDHSEEVGDACRNKFHRQMDSFDRYLGDLDPVKSSSNIDYRLETAQRLMANGLVDDDDDDDDDDDTSLYDSAGDEKDFKAIEMLHRSGDLERLFNTIPSAPSLKNKTAEVKKTPSKCRRRPATSHPPKMPSSARKNPFEPQRSSSSVGLTSSRSRQERSSERTSRIPAERQRSLSRIHCLGNNAERTEEDLVASASQGTRRDYLSKSEHAPKAPRIRRDELYSLRRPGYPKTKQGKSMSPPRNTNKLKIKRPSSLRSLEDLDNPKSRPLERAKSLRALRQKQRSRGRSVGSPLDYLPKERRPRQSSFGFEKKKLQSESQSPTGEIKRPVRRHRSRSSCGETKDSRPQRRSLAIVGGEISDRKKVSRSPTRPTRVRKPRASADDRSAGLSKEDEVGSLLHDLRRESKRNVMSKMSAGKRNLLEE